MINEDAWESLEGAKKKVFGWASPTLHPPVFSITSANPNYPNLKDIHNNQLIIGLTAMFFSWSLFFYFIGRGEI